MTLSANKKCIKVKQISPSAFLKNDSTIVQNNVEHSVYQICCSPQSCVSVFMAWGELMFQTVLTGGLTFSLMFKPRIYSFYHHHWLESTMILTSFQPTNTVYMPPFFGKQDRQAD